MIDLVTLAEKRLAKATRKIFPGVTLPGDDRGGGRRRADPARADLAAGQGRRPRGGAALRLRVPHQSRRSWPIVGGKEIARYSQQGPVTPDHAIRTKGVPLVVPAPEAGKLDAFAKDAKAALDTFVADYHAYFAAPQRAADAEQDRARSRCRASCWCRGSACSASATRRRTPRSRPTSPRPRSRWWPMPSGSAPTSASPSPTSSTSSTGRSSRPSSARRRRSRWRGASPSSPAAPRASARRRRRPSPGKAPRSSCSTATCPR